MTDNESRTFIVGDSDAGARIDLFLARISGFSRSRVHKSIKDGSVLVDGAVITKPAFPVECGSHITLTVEEKAPPAFEPEPIPLDIIYEDDDLIVINKPAGLVVHPARGNYRGTLAAGLLYHRASMAEVGETAKPGIVHRLDKETSGIMVAALTQEMHDVLSRMVHDRLIDREYTAFVWGHPEPADGTIDQPIGRKPGQRILQAVVPGGRASVTHYSTVARYRFLSKLSVRLQTGRTHQIRVHMANIGHNVFADPTYGGREKRLKGYSPDIREEARYYLKRVTRQALHAAHLSFDHPRDGRPMSFTAPLPDDLAWLDQELERTS